MISRVEWLSNVADFYVEHGCLPRLPLITEVGMNVKLPYIGCLMIMVSEMRGRLEFTAHFPDADVVGFRNKPKPAKVRTDKRPEKGTKSGT